MAFEFLSFVLAFVILLIVVNSKNDMKTLKNIIAALGQEIRFLRNDINSLKDGMSHMQVKQEPQKKEEKTYSQWQPKTEKEVIPPPTKEPETVIIIPVSAPVTEETIETPPPQPSVYVDEVLYLHEPQPATEPVASFSQPATERQTRQQPRQDRTSWQENFIKKNPDLEKFIGENLINKIGIAVLVLGIAFFVKYAIDKDWINEVGRVCIGLGCGAILVGVAHYMRNNYRSFSSVLAGGGIAVFYFTIAFAFHQYHLMSQSAAFVIMVVITAFAVALSVLYDKLELAIIATVGGFLTPFLVSTGNGNYITLFTYLIILNVGLLSLSWFKRWPALNVIALFFTELIFGSWLGFALDDSKPISYPTALLFASVFYLIFTLMNMLNQLRNRQQFKAFDFFILLFISCSYYTAGMVILHGWNNGAYQGLFTLGLGVINFLLAYYVYKKGKADRNLLFLLIGLTFSFTTLTIPIQLHGHAITLFWSAEFVLLYWLSIYSSIRLFKYSSILVCILTVISLLVDWLKVGDQSSKGLFLIFENMQGIITNVVAIVSFAVYNLLLRKNKEEHYLQGVSNRQAGGMALIMSVGLIYLTCIFGVNLWYRHLEVYDVPNVYHRLISELFGLGLLLLLQKNILKASPGFQLPPFIACFTIYMASTDLISSLRAGVLTGHYSWLNMYWHWAGSLLLLILIYRSIQGIRKNQEFFSGAHIPLSIFISLMIIVFLSVELMHIYVIIGYRKENTEDLVWQYGKAGLTALWGICSFALIWIGMKYKEKTLRIISLFLFTIVLLKLFILIY